VGFNENFQLCIFLIPEVLKNGVIDYINQNYYSKHYIAIVPLVQFTVGFLVSFAMKPITKKIGKE